ncbi:hypothetical protein [Vibrio sp. RE88]|uniref:hypothetical protein n=1 Tax=Vibrio sp. RE88 TaxID=2607610 RepID=UPI0014933951|nr:hypothetical protein [Vibrio sp. RE88]NOH63225.1 hypothetical protein [Vibrio sp. RE88]
MIERLIAMGYLDTDSTSDDSQWQGQCASRRLRWLQSEHYVTIGMQIEPPQNRLWSTQASLVLAICEEGWDCSLENRDDEWILWRCYPNNLDDETLISSIKMQLALSRYLEQEMLKPVPASKPRIWRSKL